MIGAKTILLTVVGAAALAAAGWAGLFAPERLANLDGATAFWIGCLASIGGTVLFRFWRLHEPSESYFRYTAGRPAHDDEAHFVGNERHGLTIGANRGQAFDLHPQLRQAGFIGLALLLAFGTLDSRALQLIEEFPQRATLAASGFCPDPSEGESEEDILPPGCELIVRAFELGLADSLGSCETVEAREREAGAVCRLRQRDEPVLHYSWRLVVAGLGYLGEHATLANLGAVGRSLGSGTRNLDLLYAGHSQVIASKAKASHHIWTNLPDPRGWLDAFGGGAMSRLGCLDHYQMLSHRPPLPEDPALRASLRFDHIVGQLLFDTRYEPAAGFCREYTIHWDAPADACDQLSERPEEFLRESDAWDHVGHVIERYDTSMQLSELAAADADDEDEWAGAGRWILPQRFVSFHCYVEAPEAETRRGAQAFELAGHDFAAEELRVAALEEEEASVNRYDQIASLFAAGFHYDAMASVAAFGAGAVGPERFTAGSDGYLAKLDYFRDVDIFLGDGWWVLMRDDLLDVYPYHLHMQKFIEVFRLQYSLERGRL